MAVIKGVIIKKALLALLPKNRKKIGIILGSVVLGFLLLFIAPIAALFSIGNMGTGEDTLGQQIMQSTSESEEYQQMTEVMATIEAEIAAQELDVHPTKVQIIYLFLLNGKEYEFYNFFEEYVSLFADFEDDYEIFSRVRERFGAEFTDEEMREIIEFYREEIERQAQEEGTPED